ncbi:MAG: hypothetical protein IT208_00200 [Chthonomonadales bacterium]|nr:hypothetical protein [Chthonomonadales bacterium]
MVTRSSRRAVLVGLTAGALLVLIAMPMTGWIVRDQLALCLPPLGASRAAASLGVRKLLVGAEIAPEAGTSTYAAGLVAYAARHPRDLGVQVASAVRRPASAEERSEAIRALKARFPDEPAVYATALRFAALEAVRIDRDENDDPPRSRPVDRTRRRKSPAPEALARFDRDALAGERLDPTNSFFPLMRALGLFAGHRDQEAVQALLSASARPGWNDYCRVEVAGAEQMQREGLGDRSALGRLTVDAVTVYPHLAGMRAVARMGLAMAIDAERAGRPEDGLTIRRALGRIGGRMRARSESLIGSLVGIAIAAIATGTPGGEVEPAAPRDQEVWTARRMAAYTAYMERIGHPEEARRARAERAAGALARGGGRAFYSLPLSRVGDVARWWAWDIPLLLNALWMLLLGLGSEALARTAPMRGGRPLPTAMRRALAGGAALGAVSAVAVLSGLGGWPGTPLLLGALLGGALLASAAAARLDGLPREAAGVAVAASGAALALWLVAFQFQCASVYVPAALALMGNERAAPAASAALLWAVYAPALPLLVAGLLVALSRVWRVPASVGIVRGFAGIGVPVACLLLLGYTAAVMLTARQEAAAQASITASNRGEGAYAASLAGTEWPGEVP